MNQNDGYKCSACMQWVEDGGRGKIREQVYLQVVTTLLNGGYYQDKIGQKAANPHVGAVCLCDMAKFFAEYILTSMEEFSRGENKK